MSQRAGYTNKVIDWALTASDAPWTRDIPKGYLNSVFPFRDAEGRLLVVPAEESDSGRGAPFVDAYCELDGIEVGVSLKISSENRAPRNSSVCGSKAAHLFGLIQAANAGTLLPVLCYWVDDAGAWFRCCFDLGAVLRDSPVALTGGWLGLSDEIDHAGEQQAALTAALGYSPAILKGAPVAVSPLKRESGGETRVYLNAKINHGAAGLEYVSCAGPHLPESYAELLLWMGIEADLIG